MIRPVATGTHELLAQVDDEGVGTLTLNRPERRNALSNGIYEGFRDVLPLMANDPAVRVLLVTGSGGAFCSGGDVKAMNERTALPSGPDEPAVRGHRLQETQRWVTLGLHEFPKPVVAALPGAAAGAGLSIALAADIRLASERAVLVTSFAGVAASGDYGASWFLTHLVGPSKARELFWTSPRLTADESLKLGLVATVLPDEGFDDAALAWCRDLATRAPIAQRLMKENLNRALTCDLATALDAEADNMIRSMSTDDHREAVAAFVEKRTPVFRGV